MICKNCGVFFQYLPEKDVCRCMQCGKEFKKT